MESRGCLFYTNCHPFAFHLSYSNILQKGSDWFFIFDETNISSSTKKPILLLLPISIGMLITRKSSAWKKSIYHKGWIDFNKNGKMDVFEDPSQPIDKRVADLLSQMTVEEKTCQLALYGYKRVLKEEMLA